MLILELRQVSTDLIDVAVLGRRTRYYHDDSLLTIGKASNNVYPSVGSPPPPLHPSPTKSEKIEYRYTDIVDVHDW